MKIAKYVLALLLIVAPFAGCEKKESSVKKQTTVTSPEGTTTKTTETTVETTGKNPPAAP